MTLGLEETFSYLESLYRRPIRPPAEVGLERIRHLLRRLDNPHERFPTVHITGTCGKGSTATMVAGILGEAGYRTGVFRSPHLQSYLERIAVDGSPVSAKGWMAAFERVRPVADAMERGDDGWSLGRPSLFEFVWSMAATHFAASEVDAGVIEVGVGGRLSATNVLRPEVAVLTNVSLEHTRLLGDTETAIAGEKAAIVKSGSSAVTAAEQPPVLEVIEERCRSVGADLWRVGSDVVYRIDAADRDGQRAAIRTPLREHPDCFIRLLGRHQVRNAATAVGAVDLLVGRGWRIDSQAVRRGLEAAGFPGRFEVMSERPPVVLDGARNQVSAEALRQTLDDLFPTHDIVLVVGALADKDAASIVAPLIPRVRSAVVTLPPFEGRTTDPAELLGLLRDRVETVRFEPDPTRAWTVARSSLRPNDLLLVTGSLYLVGCIRQLVPGEEIGGQASADDGLAMAARTPVGTRP